MTEAGYSAGTWQAQTCGRRVLPLRTKPTSRRTPFSIRLFSIEKIERSFHFTVNTGFHDFRLCHRDPPAKNFHDLLFAFCQMHVGIPRFKNCLRFYSIRFVSEMSMSFRKIFQVFWLFHNSLPIWHI